MHSLCCIDYGLSSKDTVPESQQKASRQESHPTAISFGGHACVGIVVDGAVGGTPVNSQVSIKSIVGSHPRKYIFEKIHTRLLHTRNRAFLNGRLESY